MKSQLSNAYFGMFISLLVMNLQKFYIYTLWVLKGPTRFHLVCGSAESAHMIVRKSANTHSGCSTYLQIFCGPHKHKHHVHKNTIFEDFKTLRAKNCLCERDVCV